MPTTKTAPKSTTTKADPDHTVQTEAPVDAPTNGESAPAGKPKRVSKVQYAFGDGAGELVVLDELPAQEAIPRNTSGLVGRNSQYVGYLRRIQSEFLGRWVQLAKFGNGGAATVARNELLGLEVKNRKTGELTKSKQRELPEGTTVADWEVEIRRVMEANPETGKSEKFSQLWVKYVGQ